MNRLTLAILGSAVAMFTVLMVFDIYQLFTTPLTPYGLNHRIPELLTIFLVGRLLSRKMERIKLHLIVVCLLIYGPLTYGLMYGLAGVANGMGVSYLFVAVYLHGIWWGELKEKRHSPHTAGLRALKRC